MPYLCFKFHSELAKLRKPLQQKLKKEISWTWTPSDSNIVQNFKKMCKNFPPLNLSTALQCSLLAFVSTIKSSPLLEKLKNENFYTFF